MSILQSKGFWKLLEGIELTMDVEAHNHNDVYLA